MEGVAFTPAPATTGYILCADCGTPIPPNSANRCVNCLRNSVDITESVPKQAAITFCRNCSRWGSPPNAWLIAELESRELLAICLRRLKGLKEVRLVDAGFVWTEPHSKRLRVKLTVQKEVSEISDCMTKQRRRSHFARRSSHLLCCNRYSKSNSSSSTPNVPIVRGWLPKIPGEQSSKCGRRLTTSALSCTWSSSSSSMVPTRIQSRSPSGKTALISSMRRNSMRTRCATSSLPLRRYA